MPCYVIHLCGYMSKCPLSWERVDGGQHNPFHARVPLQTSRYIGVIWEIASPKSPFLLGWWSGKTFVTGVPCPTCRQFHQSLTLSCRYLPCIQLTEGLWTISCKFCGPHELPSSSKGNPFYRTETVTQYPYSKLGHMKNCHAIHLLHVWWTTY